MKNARRSNKRPVVVRALRGTRWQTRCGLVTVTAAGRQDLNGAGADALLQSKRRGRHGVRARVSVQAQWNFKLRSARPAPRSLCRTVHERCLPSAWRRLVSDRRVCRTHERPTLCRPENASPTLADGIGGLAAIYCQWRAVNPTRDRAFGAAVLGYVGMNRRVIRGHAASSKSMASTSIAVSVTRNLAHGGRVVAQIADDPIVTLTTPVALRASVEA